MGRGSKAIKVLKRFGWQLLGVCSAWALWFYVLLPTQLFSVPYTTVVFDGQQNLLGARIAADGQWRFPPVDTLPKGYVEALICFEDKNFYQHFGIDPLAVARAFYINIKNKSIRQGGSTISMQVVRMALKNQPRTIGQKLKEMLLALRLEMRFSKAEILAMYAAHAPLGGNVVGLEAASWRYFSRPASQLSTAEYALLAVLPNAPAMLHLGRNQEFLMQKRNFLLHKMKDQNLLSTEDLHLALLENLPEKPLPLPDFAPHITQRVFLRNPGSRKVVTLQLPSQTLANQIVAQHYQRFRANGVHNMAVLVTDVQTGQVVAYVGNTDAGQLHGEYVDVIRAPRSSGSILKPFLYCAMQQVGQLMPAELVADIPTFFSGFNPLNYTKEYSGAVPADVALGRSLNVPAVRELQKFGVEPFRQELQRLQFKTVTRTSANYGLSLILGGAEVSLWDVANAYLGMAQSVSAINYAKNYRGQHVFLVDSNKRAPTFDAGAAYNTLNALRMAGQNAEQLDWEGGISNGIGWKTGTSYGFRDAWAVGVNAKYVVAVWVGNADGEGRPGVIGAAAAAPIMFEIFSALGAKTHWFLQPYDAMTKVNACASSGLLASVNCPEIKETWICKTTESNAVCTYHKKILTTQDGRYLLTENCATGTVGMVKSWFVLPPAWEYYYKKKNASYIPLPPALPSCEASNTENPMQLIYPANRQVVMRAKQLDGQPGAIIFKLAHRHFNKKVFWYANDIYLGETLENHEMPINLPPATYTLRLVDQDGFEISQIFEMQ